MMKMIKVTKMEKYQVLVNQNKYIKKIKYYNEN